MNGINRVYYKNGSECDLYEGQYLNGLREGYGRIILKDGSYYEGEWKNNFQEGKGKIVYSNGNYYEGEFYKNDF